MVLMRHSRIPVSEMGRVQTAAATATVGNSMATASAAMASVGQAANPAKMQQTMQQFAKENAKMDMASEMMGDAVDDALDDDEVEDETDDLMNQVCTSSASEPAFGFVSLTLLPPLCAFLHLTVCCGCAIWFMHTIALIWSKYVVAIRHHLDSGPGCAAVCFVLSTASGCTDANRY